MDDAVTDHVEPATASCPAADIELSSPAAMSEEIIQQYFTDIIDYKWTDLLEPVYIQDFTEPVGPTVTIPSSPLREFQLFFTIAIMDYIVSETNRYACYCMGDDKYQNWKTISIEDMNTYFGIMIIIGLIKLPAFSDYWHRDPLFYDNSSLITASTDRLLKIRPFLTMIGQRF
uniref:PiggyBac transposable element-derived protein domain-containing protein n=1 Tax=Amphimedon queenslandica TaxID=400682 RepID=A0A1X7UMI4_AMPQE